MSDTLTWSPTAVLPELPEAPSSSPEQHVHDALQAGTRLDEFEIIRVLGAGGFGIVYLALDHVLLRYVAIKEYMPSALAGRGTGTLVAVRSPGHAPTYAMGLESFFNEARMLASFDHQSLVKVHRFWKANGTAYMAMQYYPGRTLREVRREMPASPDETWLRAFLDPLLGALEALHGEDIYHRDIAPDNILLLPDGRPVLLDFGSARRVIGDRTQSLTAILKPNFAPIEQYADEPGMRQGPWTDLYALGATVHFMLTGHVPVPAVLRAVRDTMVAVSDSAAGPFENVGPDFLATVDWTLALAPEDRPQSVAMLRRGLSGDVKAPAPAPRLQPVPRSMPPAPALAPEPPEPEAMAEPVALPTEVPATASMVATASAALLPRPRRGRVAAIAAGALVVAALSVAGVGRFLSTPSVAAPTTAHAVQVTPFAAPPAAIASAAATVSHSVLEPPQVAVNPVDSPVEPTPPPSIKTAPVAPTPKSRAEPARPAHTLASVKPSKASSPQTGSEPAVHASAPSQTVPAPAVADVRPAKSPGELCGDRNFLSMAVCMSRQCQSPALQAHPQCVQWRHYDEERRLRSER